MMHAFTVSAVYNNNYTAMFNMVFLTPQCFPPKMKDSIQNQVALDDGESLKLSHRAQTQRSPQCSNKPNQHSPDFTRKNTSQTSFNTVQVNSKMRDAVSSIIYSTKNVLLKCIVR